VLFVRDKYNLNALSHDTAIAMIKWAVAEGVDVAEIFVDTVGPPDKYQSKLQAIFPRAKCVVAKKADSLYPVVSAASIAAKITRDEVLQRWLFKEQVELSGAFGSGYPGGIHVCWHLGQSIRLIIAKIRSGHKGLAQSSLPSSLWLPGPDSLQLVDVHQVSRRRRIRVQVVSLFFRAYLDCFCGFCLLCGIQQGHVNATLRAMSSSQR
jgi:hypothetical protein